MIGSLKGSRTSPEKLNPEKREWQYENLSFEGNTENGIDHMIRVFQRAIEVFSERHIQILELGCQSFIEVVLAVLGVEDGWLIAVVPEMTSGYETIPT